MFRIEFRTKKSMSAYVYLSHKWSLGTPKICTFKILKCTEMKKPVAPLLGEIDICAHHLFCTKFNSEQLLFEAFFDVMRIYGGNVPQSECNFPFLYIVRAFSRLQTNVICYEMLKKIFTHLVRYCLVTYFRDEKATHN